MCRSKVMPVIMWGNPYITISFITRFVLVLGNSRLVVCSYPPPREVSVPYFVLGFAITDLYNLTVSLMKCRNIFSGFHCFYVCSHIQNSFNKYLSQQIGIYILDNWYCHIPQTEPRLFVIRKRECVFVLTLVSQLWNGILNWKPSTWGTATGSLT